MREKTLYNSKVLKYNPIIRNPVREGKEVLSMKKMITMILAVLMLCSCLAACGADKYASDLAYIQEKGKLVVGISDYAPMDYKDDNG